MKRHDEIPRVGAQPVVVLLLLIVILGSGPALTAVKTVAAEPTTHPVVQDLNDYLAEARDIANRLQALGQLCDEMSCPEVDCGSAGRVLYLLELHASQLRLRVARAVSDGDRDTELLATRALQAIREAYAAIAPCIGRQCPRTIGIGIFVSSLDDNPDLDSPTALDSLDRAVSQVTIRNNCPPGVPLDEGEITVCAPCREAAERFREAQAEYLALYRLSRRDPTVEDELEEAERDRNAAWDRLRFCLIGCAPRDFPPPPPEDPGANFPFPRSRPDLCEECRHIAWEIERWQADLRNKQRELNGMRNEVGGLADLRAQRAALQARGESSLGLELEIQRLEWLEAYIPRLEAEIERIQDLIGQLREALVACEERCAAAPLVPTTGRQPPPGRLVSATVFLFDPDEVDQVIKDPGTDVEPPPPPTPVDRVDLVVDKSDAADPVQGGEEILYRITVTNDGNATSSPTTLTDNLPDNLGSPVVSTSEGCTAVAGAVSCNVPPLAPGESVTFEIRAVAPEALFDTTLTNAASVPLDPDEDDESDNSDTEETTIVPPPPPPPPPTQNCAFDLQPGQQVVGDQGCGIGTVTVDCAVPLALTLQTVPPIVCDSSGNCGDNNTIFGIDRHRCRLLEGVGGALFRLFCEQLNDQGQPAGPQCNEDFVLPFDGIRN